MIGPWSMVAAVVFNILCGVVVTLYAMSYVRRAQEAERRGKALEARLRDTRGGSDVAVVVTPAWKVFVRDEHGVAREVFVEDLEDLEEVHLRAWQQLAEVDLHARQLRQSMIVRAAPAGRRRGGLRSVPAPPRVPCGPAAALFEDWRARGDGAPEPIPDGGGTWKRGTT